MLSEPDDWLIKCCRVLKATVYGFPLHPRGEQNDKGPTLLLHFFTVFGLASCSVVSLRQQLAGMATCSKHTCTHTHKYIQ